MVKNKSWKCQKKISKALLTEKRMREKLYEYVERQNARKKKRQEKKLCWKKVTKKKHKSKKKKMPEKNDVDKRSGKKS